MRSSDGTLVYQAKFHRDENADAALRDALSEQQKIAKYQNPAHSRHAQWKGVTSWKLVTNAPFNPTQDQKWRDDVAPAFSSIGLDATYWEQADLNVRIDGYPDIERSFFEGRPRVVLTLPEAWEAAKNDTPFLPRALGTSFHGRDDELDQIESFLRSEQRFLVVHGAGGLGKTRLLLEAATERASPGGWQVLWANVETMASGGAWYEALVPDRATLLLVDDPEDERLLRQLAEQLRISSVRTGEWKVALSVRSPNDPVIRFLSSPKMKRQSRFIPLRALESASAEALCRDLIDSGPLKDRDDEWKADSANRLSKRFDRFPIWISLAVQVLEVKRDLVDFPESAEDLADLYLGEIYENQRDYDSDQLRLVLRWMALLADDQHRNRAHDGDASHWGWFRGSLGLAQLFYCAREAASARKEGGV